MGDSGPTLQHPAEASNALASTKRVFAAPGVFPAWSRVVLALPTHQSSIFFDFQFTDAIISTVFACNGLGNSVTSSLRFSHVP